MHTNMPREIPWYKKEIYPMDFFFVCVCVCVCVWGGGGGGSKNIVFFLFYNGTFGSNYKLLYHRQYANVLFILFYFTDYHSHLIIRIC